MEFKEKEYLERFKNVLSKTNIPKIFYNDSILFGKISTLTMHFECLHGKIIHYKGTFERYDRVYNIIIELKYGQNCILGSIESMYRLYCEQDWNSKSQCLKIIIT